MEEEQRNRGTKARTTAFGFPLVNFVRGKRRDSVGGKRKKNRGRGRESVRFITFCFLNPVDYIRSGRGLRLRGMATIDIVSRALRATRDREPYLSERLALIQVAQDGAGDERAATALSGGDLAEWATEGGGLWIA